MSYRSGALLTAVAFACLAPQAGAKEINKHFHESFEVEQGDTLHLRHGDGDVEVIPWDKDVLDVDVRYRVVVTRIGLGTDLDFDVEFREDGGDVYVTEKPRTSITIGFLYDREHEYQYTIRAPAYLELDLDGDDGDVSVEGWKGALDCLLEDGDVDLQDLGSARARVRTGDGEIRVEGLEGELDVTSDDGGITLAGCRGATVRARTDDGDVRVRRCAGSFRIATQDGDIRLQGVHAGRLEVRSDDGDVDLDLRKVEDLDVDVSTGDGDVTVELEPGLSAVFSIDADERRTHVDLPEAEELRRGKRRTSGKLHGGRGRIDIRTQDGRVTLSQGR
jgi:DUF4097 and DUF4098 domain-containing protein YvlB